MGPRAGAMPLVHTGGRTDFMSVGEQREAQGPRAFRDQSSPFLRFQACAVLASNWEMVMGPDIAPLAWPLGARNDILIVGGEDNLALQELSFMTPEILERVNAFMDAPVFDRVELRLVMGDRPLDQMPDIQPSTRVRPAPPRPRQLGAHLEEMNADSPVARCYAAYLRMHGVPTERKS